MKIELHEIIIRDLFNGYQDNQEEGVVAYGGRLDVRPKYQREFVYTGKQRDEVINTISHGFPLNIMYWVKKGNGNFEVLDGQQRTISICQYINNDFSIGEKYFHTLTDDQQAKILDYKLMVYFCEGTDSEKLNWFKIVNIAGEKLSDQELRNAVYTGAWLTDAKRHFSKMNCAGYALGEKYVRVEVNRQGLLELVLKWISPGSIEQYMADHQQDSNCNELWLYYTSVINWVKTIFPTYRKEMRGLPWGELYNEFGKKPLDTNALEAKVTLLMQDTEVQKKSGIYQYVLTGKEKFLNLRAFDDAVKREVYERQGGICPHCVKERREKTQWDISEMEADHISPWAEGGKTVVDNCQMLCLEHNRRKSDK
ncbi:MAG: HNH endonuclease family protein [Candidatus Cryptobacteroides sp.]